MNTAVIVTLGASCALSLLSNVLVLASVGRLHKTHNDALEILAASHNWTSSRLRDLSDLILKAINTAVGLADRQDKSSYQDGNVR